MKKINLFFFYFVFLLGYQSKAQSYRVIQTAMPFLLVQSDARARAMADTGVSTSADVFSQRWNSAKYPFLNKKYAIGFSYLPYMNKIASQLFLANFSFFKKIKNTGAFAMSFNYFNIGEIQITQEHSNTYIYQGSLKPYEASLDISYNLLLSEHFSMGITLKGVHANLGQNPQNQKQNINSLAVGISAFYEKQINELSTCRIGATISNIGPKVSYYDTKEQAYFLPINLGLGMGYQYKISQQNTFLLSVEANKLLVPTPSEDNKAKDISFLQGMLQSFSDASNGIKEEFQEIRWGLGAEYNFDDSLFLRAGYFHENKNKGDRKHLSTGIGLALNKTTLNFSYIFSLSSLYSPLENALGVSVVFAK